MAVTSSSICNRFFYRAPFASLLSLSSRSYPIVYLYACVYIWTILLGLRILPFLPIFLDTGVTLLFFLLEQKHINCTLFLT